MQGKEKVLISYEERDAFVPLKQSSRVIVSEEESGEEKKKQKKRPDSSAEQAAKDELARKKEAEKQARSIGINGRTKYVFLYGRMPKYHFCKPHENFQHGKKRGIRAFYCPLHR